MKFNIETHLHTKESSNCSEISAIYMVKLYKKEGYDTVIITDHYSKNKFDRIDKNTWNEKIDYLLNGYKLAKKKE